MKLSLMEEIDKLNKEIKTLRSYKSFNVSHLYEIEEAKFRLEKLLKQLEIPTPEDKEI